MAFSAGSFFAGVGTVCAAVTIGFAGGAMIPASPKQEPNRLERVMASTSAATPAAREEGSSANLRENPYASEVRRTEPGETSPAPADRVIAMGPPSDTSAQQPRARQAQDDRGPQAASPGKIREGHLKRENESSLARAQRTADIHPPLRKRHGIEAAVAAVRQIPRDDVLEEVSQRFDSPRAGFFDSE